LILGEVQKGRERRRRLLGRVGCRDDVRQQIERWMCLGLGDKW